MSVGVTARGQEHVPVPHKERVLERLTLRHVVLLSAVSLAIPPLLYSFGYGSGGVYALFGLALAPALIWIDAAPPVFLLTAIPDAHLFSLPAANLGGLKLVSIFALICWAVGALLKRQTFELVTSSLDLAVAGLFAVALVNITILSNGQTSITDLFLEYSGSLLLYAFVRGTVNTFDSLRLVLSGFVIGAATAGFFALVRYVHGGFVHSQQLHRLSAPGGDINDFAGVLLAAAAVAIGLAASSCDRRSRILWVSTLPLLLLAIILSYSREVFIGGVAMCLIGLIVCRGARARLVSAAVLALGAVAAFTAISADTGLSTYVRRMGTIGSLNYRGTSGRNILWSMGWDAFRTHPLFGIGIGNFTTSQYWDTFARQEGVPPAFTLLRQEVHSFYIGWAADAGVVGLALLVPSLLIAFSYLARPAWMWSRGGSDRLGLNYGLFLGFIGYFVAQAATPTQSNQLPYIVLALAGCSWIAVDTYRFRNVSAVTEREGAVHLWFHKLRLRGVKGPALLAVAFAILAGTLDVAARERVSQSASPESYLSFVACKPPHSHCPPIARHPSVTIALESDSNISATGLQKYELKNHVGFVWAATSPKGSAPGVHSYYALPWARAWCPSGLEPSGKCLDSRPPTFTWLKRFHPSWILWRANKGGEPTGPAGGNAYRPGPILDFTNPALQRYWATHFVVPYTKEGFQGITWATPLLYDPYHAVGHFSRRKRFVKQYSGRLLDGSWASAQIQSLADLLQRSRAIAPNTKFAADVPVDCQLANMSTLVRIMSHVHTIIDTGGYTDGGQPGANFTPDTRGKSCKNRWLFKTEFYMKAQRAGKSLVLVNQEPYTVTPYITDTSSQARAGLEWALANYLLVRGNHTYFWFGESGHFGNPFPIQREELSNIGRPLGDMRPFAGIYRRKFSRGVVLVNPSPGAIYTVTFPTGVYETLYGQTIHKVTMQPHQGLVLIARKAASQR